MAQRAWLQGDDTSAESLLLAARRSATKVALPSCTSRVQLAFARYALAVDEDHLAQQLLSEMCELPGADSADLLWGGLLLAGIAPGAAGARAAPPEAIVSAIDDPELRCAVLIERARLARTTADLNVARMSLALAEGTEAGEQPRLDLLSEVAENHFAGGNVAGADQAFRDALALASGSGWHRAYGRLLLRYGVVIAATGAIPGGPMAWIGLAATELQSCATWRDRAALRDALRLHGRRLADKAVSPDLSTRLSSVEKSTGTRHAVVLAGADRVVRAIACFEQTAPGAANAADAAVETVLGMLGSARELASTVGKSSDDLAQMLASAVVERDRMSQLLQALSKLDPVADVAAFASEGARIAASLLDTDCVVVAEAGAKGTLCLARHPPERDPDPSWVALVDAELSSPSRKPYESSHPVPRNETRPAGSTLVSAIAAPPFRGAIYADKLVRAEQFRDADRVLLALLGGYVALGIARLLSRMSEHVALVQLGTTLNTIRDGVLTLDDNGVVLRANAAALRMLRLSQDELVGSRLGDRSELGALASVVSKRRADAEVIALPQGKIVVTVRPTDSSSEPDAPRGLVATFVALDRAREMAYRVTGVRPRYSFDNIVCASAQLAQVVEIAKLAAAADAGVLITGESGTGKEVIAQAIHTGSRRAQAPFVGINCAALPRELLEAELFGYERGAFTGARSEGHPGKFEQAAEGTILLDEIGDMPLEMQAKLLRVLQERSVVRIGGSREIPLRARVIATTNRNLEESVARQTFRLDLLYRLRVLHIHIAPLRERPEDIPALAVHILRRVAEGQDKRVTDISPGVHDLLAAQSWPGNARELANAIETEVTLLRPDVRVLESLKTPLGAGWGAEGPTSQRRIVLSIGQTTEAAPPALRPGEILSMADVERRTYLAALDACGGRVADAAKALDVSQSGFYVKLKQWGVKAKEAK